MILTGIFFFVLMFAFFIFAYYIEPSLGIAKYKPAKYVSIEESYTRYTFTQLVQYSTFAYAIVYSLWIAINAAIYSAIGFFLVLLIRNRFLALSLPFIAYVVSAFVLIAFNLPDYRLNFSIFPFDRVQTPIWVAFVPFLVLLIILVSLMLYVRRNISKVGNLI